MQDRTLIHVVASAEWSGPQRYAFDICRHFSRQGWKVIVLTRDAKAVDRHFLAAGIEVRHAPLRDYPDYYSARALARLFREMPRREGVVHVHRYNDALTCILARRLAHRPDVRLVATRHKAEPGRDSLLRRVIYNGLDSHLFVSEFSKRKFYEGWAPGCSPLSEGKTAVTFNSLLDVPPAPPGEPERGPVYAAYRGGLKPGKGLETLIDALALTGKSRFRLKIMGQGHPDYVDELRLRAEAHGVAERIDWMRHSDFPADEFARIHFGVLPSDSPEAFGMANLEFMAYGKPQISTFIGAQHEFLIPGEDSLEVPPADAASLAQAMISLAGDATLRHDLGKRAFERYNENLSWPRFTAKILPHYIG